MMKIINTMQLRILTFNSINSTLMFYIHHSFVQTIPKYKNILWVYAQSVMKLTSSSETYCKFNIMMARLKLTANSNRFGDAFLVQCNLTRATSKFSWHILHPPPPLTSLLKNLTFLAKLKLREKEWPWTNFDPS